MGRELYKQNSVLFENLGWLSTGTVTVMAKIVAIHSLRIKVFSYTLSW